MVAVEKADDSRFEEVYNALLHEHNPDMAKEDWRNLFTYDWAGREEHRGYLLVDDEKVVGFLGTIFVERRIRERAERFCHISTWIVKPDYRGKSLQLILPIVKLKGVTITILTPRREVHEIFKRFGFQDLEREFHYFLPRCKPFRLFRGDPVSVTCDVSDMQGRLDDENLGLLRDAAPYPCRHLLLVAGNRYAYVVFNIRHERNIKLAHLLYVSDRELFVRHIDRVAWRLFRACGTLLIKSEPRILNPHTAPWTIKRVMPVPQIYKSETLKPEEIDSLYTEFPLYNP